MRTGKPLILILNNIAITEYTVAKHVKSVDANKDASPDDILPFFNKMTHKQLTLPIMILFNRSVQYISLKIENR